MKRCSMSHLVDEMKTHPTTGFFFGFFLDNQGFFLRKNSPNTSRVRILNKGKLFHSVGDMTANEHDLVSGCFAAK